MAKHSLHPVLNIIRNERRGVCSVCSASRRVIHSACRRARELETFALIESTANQVNQFGGYTGLQPKEFARTVREIAQIEGLPPDHLILGGDHLGPLVWQSASAETAMQKAIDLVEQYVAAGFTKIHIDTSMRLASDDPRKPLDDETIATRAARLAAAIDAIRPRNQAMAFVLGSEVPIPGGTQTEQTLSVTTPEALSAMFESFHRQFTKARVEAMWDEVAAVVVQPGVEFGDSTVHYYDREAASSLCRTLTKYPGVVFEGHSLDYQPPALLKQMVEDGIRILKVGPALTFHEREAYFALEMIEKELHGGSALRLSNFRNALDKAMLADPSHWQSYYHGDRHAVALKRAFSYSDRCRYYLSVREVMNAVGRLVSNLENVSIPLSLLHQYMPIQAERVAMGELKSNPLDLVHSRITNCLDEYLLATGTSPV